jgi:hypothetical protein
MASNFSMNSMNPIFFYFSKYVCISFVLFIFNISFSSGQNDEKQLLSDIRKHLPEAFNDKDACNEMLRKYRPVETSDPVLNGYIGGLYIAHSKHAPLTGKISALKTGTSMLENSIKQKPNNIELLFLRLTIQLNLPTFLGYNDNIDSDRKFVLANYKSAPPLLKNRIINFISTSGHFSEAEISSTIE